MKRWLLALVILFLASCSSVDVPQQATDPNNMSYDQAKELVDTTAAEPDFNPTALLSYSFDAEVQRGPERDTALTGELQAFGSDFPASDYLPAFTIFEGKLGLEGGAELDAQGLIVESNLYVFFSSEEAGLFIKGKGEIAEDGSVTGPFILLSGDKGFSSGSWQADPLGADPTPDPEPEDPAPNPEPEPNPDPEPNPEPEPSPEPEEPENPDSQTILDLAVATPELSTLVGTVQEAGLADALAADSEEGLSVFAPTNDAFDALESIPEGDALTKILSYHVVAGTFTAADLTDLDILTALSGDDIKIEATDDGVILNGSVMVTKANIEASNGIIHIIDAVLLPPSPAPADPMPAPDPEPEPEDPAPKPEPDYPEDPSDPEKPENPEEPGNPDPTPDPEPEPEPEPDEPKPDPDPTPDPDPSEPNPEPLAQEILSLVNDARSSGYTCGGERYASAPALKLEARLSAAAQKHSEDMKAADTMSHDTPYGAIHNEPGSSPWDRIAAEGYSMGTGGENVAQGYSSAEAVMEGWLTSAGHCRNIMNPGVTEMGIGEVDNWWTQVFASPR